MAIKIESRRQLPHVMCVCVCVRARTCGVGVVPFIRVYNILEPLMMFIPF